MIREIRTHKTENVFWQEMPPKKLGRFDTHRKVCVVNTAAQFQTHMGFGGAFTEAAAHALSGLEAAKRGEAVNALFGADGLMYNLGRVHINSCDFGLGNYHYIKDGDKSLDSFDMSREEKLVAPLVRDAQKASGKTVTMFAAPWSPPPFFKTNGEMNFGGKLKPDCAAAWAEYYVKAIKGFAGRGIKISYLSVQNEPAAVQTWDSCIYSAEEERDFIKNYLGPALQKSGLDVKIIAWDHNRDILVERANTVLSDGACRDYVWGTGFHWYAQGHHENLSVLNALHPDKHIVFTEGCVELNKSSLYNDGNVYIGDWRNGEMYGRNIINDANNFCEGFIDWNLALDKRGGPNHAGNFCEAPVMANADTNTIIYNPSYYYIGHFSRHIKPGAKRIGTCHSIGDGVYAASYKNPDGIVVTVIQNEGWIKEIALIIDGQGADVTLPGRGISTFLYKKEA